MQNPKKTIFIAEDDAGTLQIYKETFLDIFNVITTEDGSRVLEMLDTHKPDLVILDIIMPGLNGIQALELIRKKSNVPIIIITGISSHDIGRLSYDIGATFLFTKPFNLNDVVCKAKELTNF